MNSLYRNYKIFTGRNTSDAFALLLSLIISVVLLFTSVFKVAMRSKHSTPSLFMLRIICSVYVSNCYSALLLVLTLKHLNMFLALCS
jgi:hypothetical protein